MYLARLPGFGAYARPGCHGLHECSSFEAGHVPEPSPRLEAARGTTSGFECQGSACRKPDLGATAARRRRRSDASPTGFTEARVSPETDHGSDRRSLAPPSKGDVVRAVRVLIPSIGHPTRPSLVEAHAPERRAEGRSRGRRHGCGRHRAARRGRLLRGAGRGRTRATSTASSRSAGRRASTSTTPSARRRRSRPASGSTEFRALGTSTVMTPGSAGDAAHLVQQGALPRVLRGERTSRTPASGRSRALEDVEPALRAMGYPGRGRLPEARPVEGGPRRAAGEREAPRPRQRQGG